MTKYFKYALLLLSYTAHGQQPPTNIHDTNQYFIIIDTCYTDYKLPAKFNKSEEWIDKEIHDQRLGSWRVPYPSTFNLQCTMSILDTEKDFRKICSVLSWCLDNYAQAFPFLIARLSNKKKIGLSNSADLIIYDRMDAGELQFYGHGGVIQEDLFTIAGRASWILNEITGENIAVVHSNLTKTDAEEFKEQWLGYISKLKN